MPKTVPERIKDENETSIDVTWLRYHPSSVLSMLNKSKSYLNGSDKSTSGSDNNALLQHNKERIAAESEEEDDA